MGFAEVHKLKDVGKEDPLFLDDNSIQASNLEFQSNIIQTQATLEEMLKQRIQVEVQYIAMSSEAIQHSNYIHQIIQLMVQQKKLALQHMMKKLECAETKATELKREAHKLKLTCQEILEREQVLELQNRVSRLASCFTIQLILFLLVVYLFSSHPRKLLLVPT